MKREITPFKYAPVGHWIPLIVTVADRLNFPLEYLVLTNPGLSKAQSSLLHYVSRSPILDDVMPQLHMSVVRCRLHNAK